MKQAEKGKYGCVVCGKGVQHANLVSFSKQRTHCVRKPNLHTHHLVIEGIRTKIKVCTTCKRSLRGADRIAQTQAQARAQSQLNV
jgi:large subunit ribosomal protein L28